MTRILEKERVIGVHILCRQENIRPIPEWVPRELNQWSNAVSNDIDYDDFMLNSKLFASLGCKDHTAQIRFPAREHARYHDSRNLFPGTDAI